MGYLQEIVAKLEASRSSPGANLHSGVRTRASLWDILQSGLDDKTAQNAEWESMRQGKGPSSGGGIDLGQIGGGIKNAVGSTIDFIERPAYSVFGGLAAGLTGQDVSDAMAAGISGKEHMLTGDLVRKVAAERSGGKSAFWRGLESMPAIQKSALFLGTDLALDPITYIPGGAIASGSRAAARVGAKAVGKELPAVLEQGGIKAKFRTKNAVESAPVEESAKQFKEAPLPETAAITSLEETGVAKVNTDVSDKVIEKYNAPATEAPKSEVTVLSPRTDTPGVTVPEQYHGPQTESLSNVQRLLGTREEGPLALQPGRGFTEPTSQHLPGAQIKLGANQMTAEKVLQPFEAPRYAEDIDIKPFHMEEAGVPKKVTKEVEKTREIPAMGKPEDEVKRLLEGTIHPKTYSNGSFVGFGRSGKPYVVGGKAVNIKAAELFKAGMEGKVPESLKGHDVHVMGKDGKIIPIATMVKMLRDRAKTAKLVKGTKTEKYMEQVVEEIPTTRKRRLTPEEKKAWAEQHANMLDAEDLQTLRNAGNKSVKAFEEAVASVKSRVATHQYETLDELAAAIANGTAPKAVQDEVKKRLGRGKLETLIKNLKDVEEKVAKHTGTALGKEGKEFADVETSNIAKAQAELEAKKGLPPPEGNPEVIHKVIEKVDEAANTGASPKPSVDVRENLEAWQQDAVAAAVKDSAEYEFKRRPYKSKAGAEKADPRYYVEEARWREGFNKRSTMRITQNILNNVKDRLRGIASKPEYAAAKYDTAMPMLNASEQIMRKNGIEPILGGGRHGRGMPMSMHDILISLDRKFVEKHFFDVPHKVEKGAHAGEVVSWNFAPTQMSDIAEQFLHLHLGNTDLASVEQNVSKILGEPLEGTGKQVGTTPTSSHITQKIERKPERLDEITKDTMEAFLKATPELGEKLAQNAAQTVVDTEHVARALSDEAIDKYNSIVMDPKFSPGDHVQAAIERHKFVDEAAYNQNIGKATAAKSLAHQSMNVHAANTMPMARAAAVENATSKMAKATTKNEASKADQVIAKAADEEATVTIKRDGGNVMDFGRKAEMGLMMTFLTKIVPDIGNEATHTFLLNWNSAAQTYVKDHAQVLAKINQTYTGEQIVSAFNRLKSYQPTDVLTDVETEMMVAIKDALQVVPQGKFGFFNRNVYDSTDLMRDYRHFKVPEHIVLDPNDLENSWKSWVTDDPLDVISRVTAAHTHAVAKHSMGSHLSKTFGHTTGGPGRVKIIDKSGNSELHKYIDTDLWYDEDIARQMHMVDETLKEIAAGNPGGKLGKNLRNLDIATQMWKAGVTIYRPGHHARNATGDIWLAAMDGVTPKYYGRSAKVLSTRKGQYKDFDANRALAPLGGAEKQSNNVLTLTFRGETRHFTDDEVYRMIHDTGGLPSFDIIEDVSLKTGANDPRLATGIVGKVQQRAHLPGSWEGKAHKVATATSEGREHFIRIAHWLKQMEREPLKGKTFDEAVRNAAFNANSRVRKWHPDGSDLTKFERTYMRRIIPFYSWIRKAIPLVIETAISKPGRVLVYPKAMYEFAEAQGIDLQSLGNPFPTDSMFPSWIADQTQGPQWGEPGSYAGWKPGVPSADIADDYLANPAALKNTLLGSTHPFARIPIEMATHSKLRTGGPITDMSDYVDAQVPMGTYIDKLFGDRSLSTGFTQKNYEAPSNTGYENENMPPGSGFLNFLFGTGMTDYSKPSYEKFAQLEQKRAAGG